MEMNQWTPWPECTWHTEFFPWWGCFGSTAGLELSFGKACNAQVSGWTVICLEQALSPALSSYLCVLCNRSRAADPNQEVTSVCLLSYLFIKACLDQSASEGQMEETAIFTMNYHYLKARDSLWADNAWDRIGSKSAEIRFSAFVCHLCRV